MNARDQVFSWMQKPEVGCHFAMQLGKNRERFRKRWHAAEFRTGRDAAEWTRSTMPAVFSDPDIEAALYVFPQLKGPEDIAALVNDLCADDLWSWEVVAKLEAAAPPDVVPVSLVLEMPWVVDATCNIAEVIGLGDFDPMPPTRRAPFISIGFRNGGPLAGERKRPEVNLCDIPMDITQASFNRMKESTAKLRKRALGDYSEGVAKAQLTFILPKTLAGALHQ